MSSDTLTRKNRTLYAFRWFMTSPWGLLVQALAACAVSLAHAEVQGMVAFLVFFSLVMVLCDDILATTAPFLLAASFLIKMHDSYATFLPYWWLVFFPAGGMIFHFWVYRGKFERGQAFWPILAVSAAITLGGIGSISLKEYFSGVSVYHVIALGFGTLLAYVLLRSQIHDNHPYSLSSYFSHLMLTVGLFVCFMIFQYYLENWEAVRTEGTILAFQWRNNASSLLMLALPFPFYLAVKRPPFLLAGLLMFLGLLLTGSRGGLLFGGIEMVMCLFLLFLADKKRRVVYLIFTGLLVAVAVAFSGALYGFFGETVNRLILGISRGDKEVRVGLFRRALEDFRRHPLFGTGLGYMGNRDVHLSAKFALCWYHCEPLQILASLGLAGAAAYLFQLVVRLRILLRRRTIFHITLFVAYAGIEMMSLVNPGVFAPIPYLLVVTMFLVVAEKVSVQPQSFRQEQLLRYDQIFHATLKK
ncbi:MAG: O-antigen ligase family protein [Oscillospiraceae bacterium]|nr:O-antigen ligase family protein [Oscillospiraceae bacterium]